MRRAIGAVMAQRPADRPGDVGDPVAMAAKAPDILLAHVLGAADHDFLGFRDALEPDATGKPEILHLRIDDLQQVPLETGPGELRDGSLNAVERRQKVAD